MEKDTGDLAEKSAALYLELRARPESAVIWLLCHYPDNAEMDERVAKALEIQQELGLTIWLVGTASAKYPASVEKMIKLDLMKKGAAPGKILCSSELEISESLDTIQEITNVFDTAVKKNIETVLCVSNPLQLMQVYGFSRKTTKFEGRVIYIPTHLRDWRLWYVSARLALIPFAFLGIGREFPPLKFVRHARARWSLWPF
jgi:hypothetical protein